MKTLVFDLRGKIGHFRRPDTTAAHLTYPFITRTALRGLVGSILGMEEFEGEAWTGIQLLAPVRTRAQELSLLGKGFVDNEGSSTFNRPTTVELVVNPHYRIYYQGDFVDELEQMMIQHQSVYHTYLGSAFAITFPEYVASMNLVDKTSDRWVECVTVVPEQAIMKLLPNEHRQYARASGILHRYLGHRRFRGTVDVIYDVNGDDLTFEIQSESSNDYRFCMLDAQRAVCLW